MNTTEAAIRLGVNRQFLMDVSRQFPGEFVSSGTDLYSPVGGLDWSETFLRKMEILARKGFTGMPAARVARCAELEGDRLVL